VSTKRIGFLGGTFNPVHFGHLQLADAAIAECKLDQVVFIPSRQPPHKDEASITSFSHRLAMLQIVGAKNKRLSCTAIERELPTPSYTIDTLRAIDDRFPVGVNIFFIIGADAFLDLLSWKSYEDILHRVSLIVAGRKGYDADRLSEFLRNLQYANYGRVWRGKDGFQEIILLQTIPEGYSSTAIREQISKGVFPKEAIPGGVIEYIKEHALYQPSKAETRSCASVD
jgi:nicotinate-nucleotide adenylyltransferase